MNTLPPFGEPCEERESQGGVVFVSGGDERREPESQTSQTPLASDALATTEGAGAERGEAAPASALPCQDSDNCIGNDSVVKPAQLSPYRKKSRHRLEMAIIWMVNKYGLNRVGLLTLSFGVPGSGRGTAAYQEN